VNAEETADWLAAIVESSDDAIIGKTLAGVITTWNHAAERMYGYPADEMIGKHVSLLLPPVHRMRSRHPRPCRTR
jgi:PAS domain S-box-containing protein